MKKELELYLKHLLAENKSANSVRNCRSVINRFIVEMENEGYDWSNITPTVVSEYWIEMYVFANKILMEKTANTRCTAYSFFKGFFEWLRLHEYTDFDLIKLVPKPKQPKSQPRAIAEETLEDLSRKIKLLPLKYRAAILLLRDLGLRVDEALSLNKDSVVFVPDGAILYAMGKGKKTRVLPLPKEAESYVVLKEYMRRDMERSNGPLFPGDRGERMHYNTLRKYWKEHVSAKYTFHQLRHTVCTEMVNNGAPLEVVQEFMGHTYIGTTKRYSDLYGSRYMDEVKKHQSTMLNKKKSRKPKRKSD